MKSERSSIGAAGYRWLPLVYRRATAGYRQLPPATASYRRLLLVYRWLPLAIWTSRNFYTIPLAGPGEPDVLKRMHL